MVEDVWHPTTFEDVSNITCEEQVDEAGLKCNVLGRREEGGLEQEFRIYGVEVYTEDPMMDQYGSTTVIYPRSDTCELEGMSNLKGNVGQLRCPPGTDAPRLDLD